MKKALVCGVLALAIAYCGPGLYAQMGQGMQQGGGPHASPEQRLQHMTTQLNLTEDQQQKIKPILETESKAMESVRQNSSLSQQERWSQMREIRQKSIGQITPILNSDQQKKFEEMSNHHGGRMGTPGQPQSSAPPQ